MGRRTSWVCLAVCLASALLASCQKAFHQENERYVFVAANIALPYWQEAQVGFKEAARTMGVKADFTGPDYDREVVHPTATGGSARPAAWTAPAQDWLRRREGDGTGGL